MYYRVKFVDKDDDQSSLKHWKYIKRWKEKGEYRYLYPDDLTKNKSSAKLNNVEQKRVSVAVTKQQTKTNPYAVVNTKNELSVKKIQPQSVTAAAAKRKEIYTKAIDKAKNANTADTTKRIVSSKKENKSYTESKKQVDNESKNLVEKVAKWTSSALSDAIDKGKKFVENITKSDEEKFQEKIDEWNRQNKEADDNEENEKNNEDEEIKDEEKNKSIFDKAKDFVKNFINNFTNNNDTWDQIVKDNQTKKEEEYRQTQEKERTEIREPELDKILEEQKNLDPANNPLSSLNLKQSATTLDEDMALVNPNYDRTNPNTSQNCALCTIAYDLRRRGYDVEAAERVSDLSILDMAEIYGIDVLDITTGSELTRGYKTEAKEADLWDKFTSFILNSDKTSAEQENILSAYSDMLTEPTGTAQEWVRLFTSDVVGYGEGARGNLSVKWSSSDGRHSMIWEIENDKVVIRDSQTNETYNLIEVFERVSNFQYFRTDNATPTEDILKYVKNRKG